MLPGLFCWSFGSSGVVNPALIELLNNQVWLFLSVLCLVMWVFVLTWVALQFLICICQIANNFFLISLFVLSLILHFLPLSVFHDPVLRPVTHIPQGAMLTVNTNSSVSIKSEPVSPGRDRSTPCPPPSTTPSLTSGGAILTTPPQYPGSLLCLEPPTGRSPADSVSSNASSFEGSDRDDTSAADGGSSGGGAGGGSGGSSSTTGTTGPVNRSVPPDFSPSAELLRASNEPEQEGGNVKRMRLDAWVT